MKWTVCEETGEHHLKLEDGFYAVVPTVAKDWYAGYSKYGDFCLEQDSNKDIEYFDTWQSARKWCEEKAIVG